MPPGGSSLRAAPPPLPLIRTWLARSHTWPPEPCRQGFVAIDIGDIDEPTFIAEWHPGEQGRQAGHDLATFVHRGRHYLAQAFAESTDGAASQVGAVVFDVTDLPGISEAARISAPGGYRALFAYRHSSGRSLILATGGGTLDVFDIANILQGGSEPIVRLETPEQPQTAESGFDNMFAGFEPESRQDRLYAAGGGGYYFYDFSDLSDVRQLTSISSAAVPARPRRDADARRGIRAHACGIPDGACPDFRLAAGAGRDTFPCSNPQSPPGLRIGRTSRPTSSSAGRLPSRQHWKTGCRSLTFMTRSVLIPTPTSGLPQRWMSSSRRFFGSGGAPMPSTCGTQTG